MFEAAGAEVPPDDDPAICPSRALLAAHAGASARREIEPLYLRAPDAKPSAMTAVAIDIRPLVLDDLAEIEAIEQRAYHTPWSRSMFASELAKGTSICLGAFEGERLIGYVINSRYVDAWHVMNVAVDPDYQRRGIATALLEHLFELTSRRRSGAATRSRCVSRTRARSSSTRGSASARRASAAATTPTTARTR